MLRKALLCTAVLVAGIAALAIAQEPAQAQSYTEVDAAIDYYGLPPIFHAIAQRESGDDPYAVNRWSGACGPFQFLPSTADAYGFTCYDLQDPYTAAYAAKLLYYDLGLRPWRLTAYRPL